MVTKFVAAPLAEALALAGRPADADAVLAELDALPLAVAHMFDADTARARGWAAAAAGDLAGAERHFDNAATLAAASGDTVWELAAVHDLVRLGQRHHAGRVAELAARTEGPLAAARATHAEGVTRQDAALLEGASASFEALGAMLLAAEAAADAATVWRAGGEARKAAAAEQRTRRLAARCEGARTPALAVDVAVRAVLTPRELEVARLAMAGESNREIGERLHLSPKTVENRLHGIYEKLGIDGRKELGEALAGEQVAGIPMKPFTRGMVG
jgi:ATP/maltotriose-dependent transcriptional regulator MalT